MERRIVGTIGGLLRHALGFMLLGWRRMLRGALIAALITILLTEIAAMIVNHSFLPGIPAQVVAAVLAFIVAYITALTIFIWELAIGLIDLIRVVEGEVEAGARAATAIAEREIGDVYGGLRRLVGLPARPEGSDAGSALPAAHRDAMPTSETLAALAPLAARAVEYHQRQQATGATAEADQPNVASVTRLPPLPMNPVPAASLPRIEWTYEHPAATPHAASAPASDVESPESPPEPAALPVDEAAGEDVPLVEPSSLALEADEPTLLEPTPAPVADTADTSGAADVGTTILPAEALEAADTPASDASDEETAPYDLSSLNGALHISPLAAYVAPMAAPLAELAATAAISTLTHTIHTPRPVPQTTLATPVTTPPDSDAADPGAAPSSATAPSDYTATSESTVAPLDDPAAPADDVIEDSQQTQPNLPIVASSQAPGPQVTPRPVAGLGEPSAATQPLKPDSRRNTRPITRPVSLATNPLTRPRTEQARITRPVTRPLPAPTGPRPDAGNGLWERLSQALVGRTPTPTTPRLAGANTSRPIEATASPDASADSDADMSAHEDAAAQ